MEKNAMEETFQTTMSQVPAYMPGWTWNNLDHEGIPFKHDGYLLGPDEAKISARLDTYRKRISFSSCYPHHYSVYGKSVDISMSTSKTPEQIAKGLKSRFLALYLPELETHRERVRTADEYEANKKAMMQKVADYFGVEINDNGKVYPPVSQPVYCIESRSENFLEFKVECSADQAIKVFEALKEEGSEK